jgi:alpha-1,6-mannosyltransferase
MTDHAPAGSTDAAASDRAGGRRGEASTFTAPPSDEPATPSATSAQCARPVWIRQVADRLVTPTGLRFLGLAGASGVALAGDRWVGLLGVAVLAGAWLGLRTRLAPIPSGRHHADAGWLLRTGALWAVPLLLGAPLFSGDAAAYACQGQLLGHGLSPYEHGVADLPCTWLSRSPELWRHTPSPYGPWWLALSALAAAAGRWWLAVGGLRLVALAGLGLIIGYGRRLTRVTGADPARAAWLGAISPLVLLHAVSGAHNDALMAGLVVAGLALATRERTGLAPGVALGLAAGVKVTALVAVPFAVVLLAGERRVAALARATAGVTLGAVGAFAAVTAATGLDLGWLPALRNTTTLTQWTSLPTGVGMAAGYLLRAAGRRDLSPAALATTRAIGLVALVALLVALWWRARSAPQVVRAAGLALAATALLGPVFFPWYALTPLAVLAATPLPEPVRLRLGALVAGLALLVLPDGNSLASPTKQVGAFGDVVLVIALVVWAVRRLRAVRATPTPTAR